MSSKVEMSKVRRLYDLQENAILVQYGDMYQEDYNTLPGGADWLVPAKIYHCSSGAAVDELMAKLDADGKAAVGFNAEISEISQTSAV